jgi:hypothetical protein
MPLTTRERASACADAALIEREIGTNEGITMNTQLLEARQSLDHPVQNSVAAHPASARLTVSRVSAADRLALRLGMALVIWGRRNVDRVDARARAAAYAANERSRIRREHAAQRELLLSAPRR